MSSDISSDSLENLSYEDRTFAPSASFIAQANVKKDIYDLAEADRLSFWETQANRLSWDKKWSQVVDWQLPFAKWFIGGKLNATYNCLDRHVASGLGNRVAFYFEGEPGDTRQITYEQLLKEVCKATNALASLGIKQGSSCNLYADDSRGGNCHAGLCSTWCDALCCLWWFFSRCSFI